MRKAWMGILLVPALLAGCTLGAAKPATDMAGRINEVQRSLGTKLTVEHLQTLQSGTEVALFSYQKGSACGAGLIDMETVLSMEGECDGALSPAQSAGDGLRIVYGYMPAGSVARVVLRWADGTEAEAKLRKSAFYYIAEGEKLPEGAVTLTAYDKDGTVIQEPVAPAQHHGH